MKFLACRTADWKNAIPKANNAQCQIEAERIKDEQLQRTRKEHGYNNLYSINLYSINYT